MISSARENVRSPVSNVLGGSKTNASNIPVSFDFKVCCVKDSAVAPELNPLILNLTPISPGFISESSKDLILSIAKLLVEPVYAFVKSDVGVKFVNEFGFCTVALIPSIT